MRQKAVCAKVGFLHIAGKPTMVNTKSAWAAAAPAVSCQCAPASSKACALLLVRLQTCKVCPAFSKCPAMLRPMTPVPMNARE